MKESLFKRKQYIIPIALAGLAAAVACTQRQTTQGATPGAGAAPGTGAMPGTGATPGAGGAGTGATPGTGGGMVMIDDPSCQSYTAPRANVLTYEDTTEADAKLSIMTVDEKIGILSGGEICPNYDCDFDGTGVPRPDVDIDDFRMRDGPRGVHSHVGEVATSFAVAMARAASFDLDLEHRVGGIMAAEMRGYKYDLLLAPTINTLRHPGWARAQETYGEDPVLLGEMGAAFTNGVQAGGVPACPKHFAANNTDENRTTMIAMMDERTLRENYTKAFKIVVEKSDPACLMAAYNGVNGDWSTESEHLLTQILRTEWGWNGFVVSDWWATKENGVKSLMSGLDLEMPDKRAFEVLPNALQNQEITQDRVNEAARRILNVRAKFGQFTDEYRNSAVDASLPNKPEHQAVALETAVKGSVLLKNDGILPLGPKATEVGFGTPELTSIMVMGPDAMRPLLDTTSACYGTPEGCEPHGMGDRGSSNTNPPIAITYLDGLTAVAGAGVTVSHSNNAADAAGADVVVIPVTMQHEDEGEAFGGGGDRDALTLGSFHPDHWDPKPTFFINEVAAVNPNVVVLLAVGSAVVLEDWETSARAIVQPFYPGQSAGEAVAKLLFGQENFSAKLPFTVAQSPDNYPVFGNKVQGEVTYDYLHGYRAFEAGGIEPRYWFGHGLSYTTFEYSDLQVLCSSVSASGRLNVQVTVTNTGAVAGTEIVQGYIGFPNTTVGRPKKELKTFTRVDLAAGESKSVQLQIPVSEMAYWSETGWALEAGVEHTVIVAPSANPLDPNALSAPFTFN